jgi:hypothetical protein
MVLPLVVVDDGQERMRARRTILFFYFNFFFTVWNFFFKKKTNHNMIREESGLNNIVKRVARAGETIPAVAFSEAAANAAASSFDAAETASWVGASC